MNNTNILNTILTRTVDEFKQIYGSDLRSVILYGSYARGDYDSESDIDVVALVNKERHELNQSKNDIVRFSSNIDLEYGIMLSASALPYDEFLKYKDDIPYYSNIASEGVVLNA